MSTTSSTAPPLSARSGPGRPRAALYAALGAVALVCALLASAFGAQPARGDVPGAPGWDLAWSDDFDGAAGSLPSSQNWQLDLGHGYPGGPANWGTGEIQNYTDSTDNIALDGGGNLRITPLRDGAGNWTSARIETKRADFKAPEGGTLRIEGRVRMPDVTGEKALGYWPAFWALGAPYRGNYWNWPAIGEFDVMENVNGMNRVWGVLHCGVNPGGPCNETNGLGASRVCPGPACQADFHTYRFEWDRSGAEEELRWYVDGQEYHSVTEGQIGASAWSDMTSHAGYFILLNVAMGGAFPDGVAGHATPTAATEPGHSMLVDYVAVWTRGGDGGDPGDPTDPPGGDASTVYLGADGGLNSGTTSPGTVTLDPAGGGNHDGNPHRQQTFTLEGVDGSYDGGETRFDLFVDAGEAVGNGQQVRISYDRTGDGSWDRSETYHYFATDPVPGFEHYTEGRGLKSSSGAHGAMDGGTVRVEVWNAIGNGSSTLGTGDRSVLHLPFG
ncbi:glycoside hydrolase family 16 protein [Streptomyces sp. DSM 42041]|uniref:Glycoside hydrolase family 16 protein n=1 Tax=Streptomyces hazeniae TaxID=3075538 RepID=A0ABU2NTK2_9ACTN|nr:glycoside hydrolase family 16 protein [Streptomyces sp. DSM 42041]MDT0380323.1 glycoside hydrolase family 16 protein [Streptomyces sp. DSM 42041]